jgi:hypothetical protein
VHNAPLLPPTRATVGTGECRDPGRPDSRHGTEPNLRVERLRDVTRIAAITMVALATTGCIGSGSSASSSAQSTTLRTGPRTDVWITYTVPTCPPGTRCVQAPATQKYYIVSRQLTSQAKRSTPKAAFDAEHNEPKRYRPAGVVPFR